jgi:septal ring factor EnvC (AmiA/AmiB activator)
MPPYPETVEEHWRVMMLERLQKLETSSEAMRTDLVDIKTAAAVAANESKTRTETMQRVESDLKSLATAIHSLDRAIHDTPKGQADLEKRIKVLEDWQSNQSGRLTILGTLMVAITSIITATITALIVRTL